MKLLLDAIFIRLPPVTMQEKRILCDVFGESVTFPSNIFIVSLLIKVMVLRKVSLSITTPKQLVLV